MGPDQLPSFYHAVLTFERFSIGLNIMTTTKKVVIFSGEEKWKVAPAKKKVHAQRKSWLRVWEKGPRWYAPPPSNS